MVQRSLLLGTALLGLIFTVGCTSEQKQTFDVTVTDRTGESITLWMTKALPPANDQYEYGWMPPEAVAVGTTETEKLGGIAIQQGDTAHTVLSGTFTRDDVAILRVYVATDLNTILAISRGNPDRLDIPLDPGKTDIDIVKQNGQLAEVRHGQASAASQ